MAFGQLALTILIGVTAYNLAAEFLTSRPAIEQARERLLHQQTTVAAYDCLVARQRNKLVGAVAYSVFLSFGAALILGAAQDAYGDLDIAAAISGVVILFADFSFDFSFGSEQEEVERPRRRVRQHNHGAPYPMRPGRLK